MKQLARLSFLALCSCLSVLAPPSASAQVAIYRWIDAQGDIHVSQGVDSVPSRFRAGAVIIGYDQPPEPSAISPPRQRPGVGQVRFTPGQPIIVTARINSAGSAQLMLDTGAARTVVSPTVLSVLGVSYAGAVRGSIKGVTGETEVDAVRLESIDVDGARFGPLLVISHDPGFGPQKGDGLLGRDYLDNFSITIDNAAGLLTLTPK
jgi:hypothetical protein